MLLRQRARQVQALHILHRRLYISAKRFSPPYSPSPSPAPASARIVSRLTSSRSTYSRQTSGEAEKESPPKPSTREPNILEKFKLRKLKGSLDANSLSKPTHNDSRSNPPANGEDAKGVVEEGDDEKVVVRGFEGLGLDWGEVKEAMEEMGVFVPSEVHFVGISPILEGKSLVLSAASEPGERTLAYLLPLLQLLRRSDLATSRKPWHPQAIVLCATDELSDQVFEMANFIHACSKLKSKKRGSDGEKSNVPIGLLVGTPYDILEQIEEGYVVAADLKYLVLDDADSMLASGLSSDIQKLFNLTKEFELQTIMITSDLKKLLGEKYVEDFEHKHGGEVTATALEMDKAEVFQITESLEALKKKIQEAVDSFCSP